MASLITREKAIRVRGLNRTLMLLYRFPPKLLIAKKKTVERSDSLFKSIPVRALLHTDYICTFMTSIALLFVFRQTFC